MKIYQTFGLRGYQTSISLAGLWLGLVTFCDVCVMTLTFNLQIQIFRNAQHWPNFLNEKSSHLIYMNGIVAKNHYFCPYLVIWWPWPLTFGPRIFRNSATVSLSSNWSGRRRQGNYSIDISTFMIRIFQTPKWQFVPPLNVPNVKTCYDPGDLENKVKVKIMIYNKRSCHCVSCV